jgi:transposase
MAEGSLLMSGSERERAHVVRQALEHRLGQREASERLGISVRQFKRLVRCWREDGDAGLVSRQRGQASHNQLAAGHRTRISGLLKEQYHDFGPTLAAEKLLELDGIEVSRETIRQLQVGLGLWKPKSRRVRRVFQLRERRARFGELIQIDCLPLRRRGAARMTGSRAGRLAAP